MKRVSIKDVAKEVGVSTATVSYVLNGKVGQTISAETTSRIHEAVRKLNYVPSIAASSLKSKKTNLIGLVIPQTEPGKEFMFANPFYGDLLSSIEYAARMEGYHILLSGPKNGEGYVNIAKNRGVDGIIIVGAYPDQWMNELHDLSIPVVLVDTYSKDPVFHTIGINDRQGGCMATEYLIRKGHQDIAFLSGAREEHGVIHKRYQGYCDALSNAGIALQEEYLFSGNVSFEYGKQAAALIANAACPISAVFATADIMAVGLIAGFHELGISVPGDISVIGFDDSIIAKIGYPPLTTVHQDVAGKGIAAVEFVINAIGGQSGKQEKILPLSIVERSSVSTR